MRLIIAIFILLASESVLADTDYYYITHTEAVPACQAKAVELGYTSSACSSSYGSGTFAYCGGNGSAFYRRTGTTGNWHKYHYCGSGTSCASGQVNPTTGQCVVAPTCTSGESGNVSVGFATKTTGRNTVFSTGDGSGNHTYCSNGCMYNYNDSSFAGTGGASADNTVLFYNFTGTKTGATCSTPTGTSPTGTDKTPTAASAVPYENCVTNSTGKKVCATGNGDPRKCGFVSTPGNPDVEICPSATDDPNCQTIPGFAGPVCSGAAKNCGWLNGQYICAEPDSGEARNPENTTNCVENEYGRKCVTGNEGVEETTEESTQQNPDGSTTKHKQTCNNVIGDDCTESTTTDDGDGNSTGTSTGGNDGDSKNLGDIAANTKRTADNTGDISSLMEQVKDLVDPSGSPSSIVGDNSGLDGEMDDQIAGLGQDLVNESSFLDQNLFDIPDSTDCQAIHQTAAGRTFDFDPCEKLEPMRDMLGWFFYVMVVYFAFQTATRGNNR